MTSDTFGTHAQQPHRNDLAARLFQALYQDYDLHTIGGVHVVVAKDAPFFTGRSLGDIARQISDHQHPGPSGSTDSA